jgi:hypothetical protein
LHFTTGGNTRCFPPSGQRRFRREAQPHGQTLTCSASGGSDIDLSGRVDQQTVDVSGGSYYNAFGLQSSKATVCASGSSDVSVSVDGELAANVGGGSDVRDKGATHSGGSSVRRVN